MSTPWYLIFLFHFNPTGRLAGDKKWSKLFYAIYSYHTDLSIKSVIDLRWEGSTGWGGSASKCWSSSFLSSSKSSLLVASFSATPTRIPSASNTSRVLRLKEPPTPCSVISAPNSSIKVSQRVPKVLSMI